MSSFSEPLPHSLFKGATDGHHLAHRLHLRAQRGIGAGEFFELPLGNLDHYIIDGRLEAGGRLARDIVADFVQPIAHRQLGCNLRDRKSRSFRRQRRAARNARVHLDDDHASGPRIDGELHVRSACIHADLAQAADRAVAHHLVFAIGERLRRRHRDGIAGMHPHRIEILDGTDDDDVIRQVAHHLQLVFLPSQHALFD